jgi:hypothetical protein
MIPGKDALSALNTDLQRGYGVTITPTGIIDAMQVSEIPNAIKALISNLSEFARTPVKGDQRQDDN